MRRSLLLLFILSWSCGPDPIPEPESVVLVAPANLEACNSASLVNDNERQVRFQWNASLYTDSYNLVVQNTLTKEQYTQDTSLLINSIILPSGAPYRWFVQSRSVLSPVISTSENWYFYLEDTPETTHFPYPAVLLSPENESSVSLTGDFSLFFEWEGNDLDNDIISYDFYLGTDPNQLQLIKGNVTQNGVSQVLKLSTTYFWNIVSRDSQKNLSTSDINTFKTN